MNLYIKLCALFFVGLLSSKCTVCQESHGNNTNLNLFNKYLIEYEDSIASRLKPDDFIIVGRVVDFENGKIAFSFSYMLNAFELDYTPFKYYLSNNPDVLISFKNDLDKRNFLVGNVSIEKVNILKDRLQSFEKSESISAYTPLEFIYLKYGKEKETAKFTRTPLPPDFGFD